MKLVGLYWNNREKPIYNIKGKNIVLNKWNGDNWEDCFEVKNNLITKASNERYIVMPIYTPINRYENETVDLLLLPSSTFD